MEKLLKSGRDWLIKPEACPADWKVHLLQGAMPLRLTRNLMNFEPEAVTEPGFNRRKGVLPLPCAS